MRDPVDAHFVQDFCQFLAEFLQSEYRDDGEPKGERWIEGLDVISVKPLTRGRLCEVGLTFRYAPMGQRVIRVAVDVDQIVREEQEEQGGFSAREAAGLASVYLKESLESRGSTLLRGQENKRLTDWLELKP